MLPALHICPGLSGSIVLLSPLPGHVLALLGGLAILLGTMSVAFLWRTYVLDLIGDCVRPSVERLRARWGLASIDESPTRRTREARDNHA